MNTIVPLSAENAAYAVRLAEELHSMGSLKGIPFDQQYMLSNALKMLNDPSWHCYLAVDKNNYLVYRVNYKKSSIEIINFRGTKQKRKH